MTQDITQIKNTIAVDKQEMWKQILSGIYSNIDRGHLLTIFINSAILSVSEDTLVIGFASIIGPEYVKEKYHQYIVAVVKAIKPEIDKVEYEMKSSIGNQDYPDKLPMDVFMQVIGSERKARKVPNKQEILLDGGMRSKILNQRYRLDNFVPGSENKLVHAAAMAVAAKPAGIYNPLYVYGGVGLGKTHLLQAIGHKVLENYPNKKVVYMTAENFINRIISAIGKKHTKPFKDQYRNLDCLIVDDIQFFANKVVSEQEFFHTFNDLYDNGKQIILSADKPPRDLEGFDDRLKSRFGMGMLIEINPPCFETRLEILKSKCQEYQMFISPEVFEYIAYHMTSSVREMIGVLTTVVGESELRQSAPTLQEVAQVVGRSIGSQMEEKTCATAEEIIDAVAEYFRISRSELLGDKRRKDYMQARQVCVYLIRKIINHSYETIGEYFGGRNHTTILHSCNKVANALRSDQSLQKEINDLKRKLGA